MKKLFYALPVAAMLALAASGCGKTDDPAPVTTTTPATTGKGVFTAVIAGDAYSAPDSSYLFLGGSTIAVFSKDNKGRSFQMAIFEKDFPVDSTREIAYSPSVAYIDNSGKTYVAKSGTMTVTTYGRESSGRVNRMAGRFSGTFTADQKDIQITEGKFDVKTK